MRRGLFEALDQAQLLKPDLLTDETFSAKCTDLIRKCIVAADQVKRGVIAERDMSVAIYGQNVPRPTLHKLITRTQRVLEEVIFELTPKTAEGTMQSMWTSMLHLYTTGITAYYGNRFYLAHERLSTVLSSARDPYMLPLALSAGLSLMFLETRMGRHDKALKAIASTQKVVDNLVDTWYWMAIYAELLAISIRKYNYAALRPRFAEIDQQLEELRTHGLKTASIQAQMVAALCAYMTYQALKSPRRILQWVDIYKKASQRLDPDSEQYKTVQTHMYLRAYQELRDDKGVIPVLQELIAQERSKPSSASSGIVVHHISWMATSLIAVGRYEEAKEALGQINNHALKNIEWYVRPTILIQRELALGMLRDTGTPFDRRVVRAAIVKNQSAVRSTQYLPIRLGASYAMLLHAKLRGSVGSYTSDIIAEKLQQMLRNHQEIRGCARTSAFIRLVALREFHDGMERTKRQHNASIKSLMAVFVDHPSRSIYEIVRYEKMLVALYGRQTPS